MPPKLTPNKNISTSEVRILLGGFGFILILTAALIFLFFRSLEPVYDFAAYACPCAAGVIAGGALYLSKAGQGEDHLYKVSVFLLFVGFMAYIRTKPCWEPLAAIVYFLLAAVMCFILGRHLDASSSAKNSWTATLIAVVIFMIPVSLALFSVFYTIDNFNALFPGDDFKCYQRK